MDEKNNVTKSHKVLLANRKNGAFSGVVDVLSFDVAEILLETELGMLLIKGHDLHVNRLSLEKGEIDIEGRIDSLTYSEPKNFTEAVFLGISVLVGMGLFLLYDIFRIFRRIVPHGAIWIGVEDFCYWLLCTAAVFLMLYQENDGMIRGFAIGGVIFGMILYFFLLSRFVVKINVCILKKILGIAGRITGFVTKPFRKIGRKIISFLCKQLKKWIKMIKMSLCKL